MARPPHLPHRQGRSAFALLLLGLAASGVGAAQPPDCAPGPVTPVSVRYVIDGDTVVLADDSHVRLVGVDTPELGGDELPDQPGAVAARDWLRDLLRPGTAVNAATDAEDRDRHGRQLRHLFLADGTNVQAALLEAGLATALLIPPSLAWLDCYQKAMERAQRDQRGLWARREYQILTPAGLPADTRGYRMVRTRIGSLHRTPHGAWLELEGMLSATIPAASMQWFDLDDLARLEGKTATLRGMVYPRGSRLRLYLRHPVDLVLDNGAGNPASYGRSKEER